MSYTETVIQHSYPGFSPVVCGQQACPPSHVLGPVMRTHHLLYYVVSGRGVFRRGGKAYPVTAGALLVVPPYEEVVFEADQHDPWQYRWIGFTADLPLPDAWNEPVVHCEPAGRLFEEMQRCHTMGEGKGAFLTGKLWELCAALTEQQKPAKADHIQTALGYMHTQYMNGVTVGELADRLGLDRSYFYTLFKEQVGVSPQEYLVQYRMEQAARFMTEHGQSPSAAALSVGYTDISQFSKMFKRRFGVSPRAYKKGETPAPKPVAEPPVTAWHDEIDVVLL